ncbi:MAG: hypothetical protein ACX94C_02000 [Phycisphaerales bacterium]
MARDIRWYFLKITLQSSHNFESRKDELIRRFTNSATYTRKWGKTSYSYELTDVARRNVAGKDCLIGYINRSPKVAHGRQVNRKTRTSTEAQAKISDIYDATEFIYHLRSCQMAVHDKSPFKPSKYTADAVKEMLVKPIDSSEIKSTAIHVDIIKDIDFSEQLIEESDELSEVRLVYAKPNPGTGDDDLDEIDFGLISEKVNADQASIQLSAGEGDSLDKSEEGFIRRSIRTLLEGGYLKKGVVVVDGNKHDLKQSTAKTLTTAGYEELPPTTKDVLLTRVSMWARELRGKWPLKNTGQDQKPEADDE